MLASDSWVLAWACAYGTDEADFHLTTGQEAVFASWHDCPAHQNALKRFPRDPGARWSTVARCLEVALTTGARQAEIMTLQWGQIDFMRQVITLYETKNGDRRAIPLVGEAFALLKKRSKVRDLKDDRLFPPTAKAKKAQSLDLRQPWEAALKTAGIPDFHWHDLRHTAASYLAMSGVSLVEIAKVLGHRTLQMVARYSHLSNEHIVATGEKLAARLGI